MDVSRKVSEVIKDGCRAVRHDAAPGGSLPDRYARIELKVSGAEFEVIRSRAPGHQIDALGDAFERPRCDHPSEGGSRDS
jgi:hypothetical protein